MWRKYIAASILLTVALFVLKGALDFDFTWDDKVNISGNSLLKGGEFKSVLRFWESPYENLYIPVTYSVWFLLARLSLVWSPESQFSGSLSPVFFHTASLVIHLANVLLVYMILIFVIAGNGEKKNKKVFAAGAGALFFAIHPVQVETVCWATGMKDLLSGFFSLSALLLLLNFFTRYRVLEKTGQGSLSECGGRAGLLFYSGASILFFMALLSKPNAAVLPLLALFLTYFVSAGGFIFRLKYLLPWVLLALPFVYVTKSLQPDSSLVYIPPLFSRLLIASDALTFYIFRLLFPFNLAIDYGRTPEYVTGLNWFYLYLSLPVTLVWIFVKGVKFRHYLLSLLIFITGILPVSGVIPFAFQFFSTVADRYLYLSMLGPSIAVAFFLVRNSVKYASLFFAIIFLCFGFLTGEQKSRWKNDIALFEHAGKVNSRSSLVRYNLGVTFAGIGDLGRAEKSFLDAIRLRPHFFDAINGLGEAFLRQGKLDKAEGLFKDLLLDAPKFERALNNMGIVQRKLGKNDEALRYFREAVSVKPDYAKAHNNLGVQLATSGDTAQAIYHFKQAIKYSPGYLNAVNNLDLLLPAGDFDKKRY